VGAPAVAARRRAVPGTGRRPLVEVAHPVAALASFAARGARHAPSRHGVQEAWLVLAQWNTPDSSDKREAEEQRPTGVS
jgi:hypothetical protein